MRTAREMITTIQSSQARERSQWFLAAFAVLVAAGLHIYASLDASGPKWAEDEIGVMANSYVIAGVGRPWSLAYFPYYPGFSVILAPIWWITRDPGTAYRIAVEVSALSAIAAIAPLSAIARRFGVRAPTAIVLASVISMSPARTIMSNFVLTENFLVLMVALTAIAGIRYFESRTVGRAAIFGLAAAYTFFTHGRAIPVVLGAVIGFALTIRRNRYPALVGIVVTIGATAIGYLAYKGIVSQIYASTARESTTISEILALGPKAVVRSLTGQAWYQVAAWGGLTVLGGLVVAERAIGDLRRRVLSAPFWGFVTLVGIVAFNGLTGATALRDPSTVSRLDYWAYGRYLDAFMIPVAVIGAAVLLKKLSDSVVRWYTFVVVSVVVTFALFILPLADPGTPLAPINVGGIFVWKVVVGHITDHRVVALSLAAAVGAVWAARRLRARSSLVLVPFALYFAVSSVVVNVDLDAANQKWRDASALREAVSEFDPSGQAISYDVRDDVRGEQNRATFWLSPIRVEPFDSTSRAPSTPLVISRWEWPQGEQLGARRVVGFKYTMNALWVMPGALQDQLSRRGDLERPEGAPALRNFDYSLVTDGIADGTTCRRASDECRFSVDLTNRGIDVWPALGTRSTPTGTVRFVAWWVSGGVVRPQIVDLPRSVFPGDDVVLDVHLDAPSDIPDGPATVELGLVEEGIPGFTPEGQGLQSMTVLVTG